MSQLVAIDPDDWEPRPVQAIAVLDFEPRELTSLTGWRWHDWEVDGLGRTGNVFLAWNGRARFWLEVSRLYEASGVSLQVGIDEDDPQGARSDFLAGAGLGAEAFLAIREREDVWFARWDPPHDAGTRPATATHRPGQLGGS